MTKETLLILLAILMLTIVLGLLIFVMREEYLYSVKKMGNRNKMISQYYKDIKITKEEVNVNTRLVIYQHFDSKRGYSESRVTPESNPILKEKNVYTLKKNKGKFFKGLRIFFDVLFIVLFAGVLAFNIYSRVTNRVYSINNVTSVTIATGSMEEKNESNEYLITNSLNNQIKQFSLIGLNKVNDTSSIKIYGIYGYKNENNQLIIHRIIKSQVIDNEVYYTFRGDANSSSDYYLVNAKDVLYEYNGYQNIPLGYFLSFLGSIIGSTSLIYLVVALFVNDYFDSKKEVIYKKGLMEYIRELNSLEDNKLYSSN